MKFNTTTSIRGIKLSRKRTEEDVTELENITSSSTAGDDVGDDEKRNLHLIQACKIYPKIVGYCFGLVTVILLWGYDLVIVGTIQVST
jgi:hypothetical protein